MDVIKLVLFSLLLSPANLQAVQTIAFDKIPDLVKKNNIKVELARLDLEIAKKEEDAANYPLDINLALAAYYEKETQHPNYISDLTKTTTKTQGKSLGLTKTFSYGTHLDVSFQSLRVKTNSLIAISDDRTQSALQLNIKQPLLKGFSKPYNISEALKAPHKINRYKKKLTQTLNEEINESLKLYWQSFGEHQKIKLRDNLIKYYQELYTYTGKAYKKGKKSRVDFFDAKAKLSRQKALKKKEQIENLSTLEKLKRLLFGKKNIKLSEIQANYSKKPNPKLPKITKHIALEIRELELRELEIERDKNLDSSLPTLDLNLGYLSQGLGSRFSGSFKQINNSDHPEYSVELTLSWPLPGSLKKATQGKYQAKLQRKKLELIKERVRQKNEIVFEDKRIKNLEEQLRQSSNRSQIELTKMNIKLKLYKKGTLSFLELAKSIKEYEESMHDMHEKEQELFTSYANYNNLGSLHKLN
jgi:outer membrane protein TolC